jgi:aspartate racemase
MKTPGIVGGIGPESTVEYYRYLISFFREREAGGNYPEIIINSINMTKMLELIAAGKFDEVTAYMANAVNKLADARADFCVLASNTPHIVFNGIRENSRLPLLSIVEETCGEVEQLGFTRVGLFGTRFTMQSGFYEDVFNRYGISVVSPEDEEQAFIHDIYMNELVNGIIKEETRERLLEIVRSMTEKEKIQGLILGGTELPLILKDGDPVDVPYLNTTVIHVRSMIDFMFDSNPGPDTYP